jgi:REase associating with pPIWI_RE/pPIWI_RE three-gene island domain Y
MELALEDAQWEGGPLRAGPRADDDYLTVTMLASGLAGILAQRSGAGQGGRRQDGLLPAAWRAGYARLWWRCQEQGVNAPESDLDLLAWCARPFAAWPVALSLSAQDLQSCLVVDEELSGFAEQGARMADADVEAEWTENRVYQALRTAALASGSDDDAEVERVYAVLRRRLIDHPVVTDLELKQWEQEFARTDNTGQTYVRRLVDEAYLPRPAPSTYRYFRCPGCHNTVPDPSASCGTPGCPARPAEAVTARALAVVYEQHRATRRFIHDPGLVEARLLDALAGRQELAGRVRVTAYPRIDALDILIEFLKDDGGHGAVAETWGVDAKDQESARLLGKAFSWPGSLPCDRRFLVLPEHRAAQTGYVADLAAELDGRVGGIEVVAEKRLLSMVTAAARRPAR